jgi:hypothetical protein
MFFGECPTRVSCRSAGLWWQEDITHNSAVFAHLLYQHHRRQQRDTTLCCDFYILWSGFWSNCDALVPYNCQIEDSILMMIDDGLIDWLCCCTSLFVLRNTCLYGYTRALCYHAPPQSPALRASYLTTIRDETTWVVIYGHCNFLSYRPYLFEAYLLTGFLTL